MVPLTTQHLQNEGLLEDFATWRNRHPEAWLDQRVVVSVSSTRIAFLVLDTDGLIIGRIGIMDIEEKSAMTDSLIRGRSSSSTNLLFCSFLAMLKWVFVNTGIDYTCRGQKRDIP